jgi:hypothetical protein
MLHRRPDLRSTFQPEADSLRLKLQKLEWSRWSDTPPYP